MLKTKNNFALISEFYSSDDSNGSDTSFEQVIEFQNKSKSNLVSIQDVKDKYKIYSQPAQNLMKNLKKFKLVNKKNKSVQKEETPSHISLWEFVYHNIFSNLIKNKSPLHEIELRINFSILSSKENKSKEESSKPGKVESIFGIKKFLLKLEKSSLEKSPLRNSQLKDKFLRIKDDFLVRKFKNELINEIVKVQPRKFMTVNKSSSYSNRSVGGNVYINPHKINKISKWNSDKVDQRKILNEKYLKVLQKYGGDLDSKEVVYLKNLIMKQYAYLMVPKLKNDFLFNPLFHLLDNSILEKDLILLSETSMTRRYKDQFELLDIQLKEKKLSKFIQIIEKNTKHLRKIELKA